MKNFVKAMDHHEKGIRFLSEKCANKKSDAKLNAGVFVGPPDIRDLMKAGVQMYVQHRGV